MSYDFLVFDPEAWPHGEKEFMTFYDAEIRAPDGKMSYDPATLEHPGLNTFYEEMKPVFTPFNGPDNVDIGDDASQLRIMRTCEYSFRPHSIYMCFRWPAESIARTTAWFFAKHLKLGFYHVSVKYGQAVFPGRDTIYPTGRHPDYGGKKT